MSESLNTFAEALGDRYRIDREVGAGGMATVYLAQDVRHDRPVALKVLHADLAHALGPERFQREIRLAARLQHPHILTVLDSGETAGRLWFTMPFVEGESLRDRLVREKQLPVDDALRIAREVADALSHAHEHGIVHRDIKPENILLTGTHALVADFGIARALGASAHDEQLTQTGTSLGTAAYMSPEQAAGERDLDARSDVYSLAIVLYEMLAGETPFAAATPQAMIARRFTDTPRPLREIRESVPEVVASTVQSALSRTVADRIPSARAFADGIDQAAVTASTTAAAATIGGQPVRAWRTSRLAVLGIGLVLGSGLLFAWRERQSGAEGNADGPRRIAVMPFQNVGDSVDAYFADGLTDAVRGKLTSIAGVEVIAAGSSNEYRATTKSSAEIARELGVDYLLEGKVRWARASDGSSRVQVSPTLIRASTATVTWQQPFDASLTDVFQVQADIASQVAGALNVALGDSAQREIAERPTRNLPAYDAYLHGVEIYRTQSSLTAYRRAITYLEQATTLDPEFAKAWSMLLSARSTLYNAGAPTPELAAAALHALERAEALAPGDVESLLARGNYHRFIEHDARAAERAYARALRVAPGDARVVRALGSAESDMGQFDSALVHLRRATELDPRSAGAASQVGVLLLRMRHYDEATGFLDKALELYPKDPSFQQDRISLELARGDLPEARAVLERVSRVSDPIEFIAYMATFNDLGWVLSEAQTRLLLRLSPSAFGDDRGSWALALTQAHWLLGDSALTHAFADSAQLAFEAQRAASPDDTQLQILHALSLAFLGKHAQAISEVERALADSATMLRTYFNYFQHQQARIYVLSGQPDRAIDLLEPLLRRPGQLSRGWLRIDPNFAPLRGNPGFERLIADGQ